MAPKKAMEPAPKRAADSPAEGEPPAKKATIEESEVDDPEDTRPKIDIPVTIQPHEMTLNVMPTLGGRLLMPLSDCGLQHLLAGARANVGIKSGRHLFEARIVETLIDNLKVKSPAPKVQVRIGFSLPGSSLFLGENEESICWDSEAFFHSETTRKPSGFRFGKDHIIGVLLNLDANTVSMFRDGERVAKPMELPESLKGKALCPHVTFRGVSLQLNFGPKPMAPLSFKCRMVAGAATEDVEIAAAPPMNNGKCEVVFPMAVPDEGPFDWLEAFLEENPHHVELSNRQLVDWVTKSGIEKRNKLSGSKSSNDRPEVSFGIPALEDLSARKIIHAVAPLAPRNYVIMEVRGNLLKSERTSLIRSFGQKFQSIACVAVGEPAAAHKTKVHAQLLKQKQVKIDAEFRSKKAALERKKAIDARQKALKQTRDKVEALKKAAAAAKKKDDGDDDAEANDEEKEDEKAAEDEKNEEEEEKEEEPPAAELTEEEKRTWYSSSGTSDMAAVTLNTSFANFDLPTVDEGFSEIRYDWLDESAAKDYLAKWKRDRKLTTRVEDIQPSQWFSKKFEEWTKAVQEWQQKQKTYTKDPEKKALLADKAAEAKAAAIRAKEKETAGDEDEEKEAEVDVLLFEDVNDIGDGEPLYAHFVFEDWTLVSLRFELYLLVQAFRKDVDDVERPGVGETHLAFYYTRYYKKQLTLKHYGFSKTEDLLDLVKDTIAIDSLTNVLAINSLADDEDITFDMFLKLTEDARRERQRRIDAGDTTAKLKFLAQAGKAEAKIAPATSKSMAPTAAAQAKSSAASWPSLGLDRESGGGCGGGYGKGKGGGWSGFGGAWGGVGGGYGAGGWGKGFW